MDLAILFLISTGIPISIFMLVALTLFKTYKTELEVIGNEIHPDKYLGKKFFGQFMVLTAMAATPIIYGLLTFTLITMNESPLDPSVVNNLALAACISVGLSGGLVIFAHLPLVKNAIKILIWSKSPPKNIDTPEKRMKWYAKHGGFPFSKFMALNANTQLSAIFGLLFAVLILVSFGMLDSGDSMVVEGDNTTSEDLQQSEESVMVIENITLEESEQLVNAAILLGIFNFGCLLYAFGVLRVEGDLEAKGVFNRKLIYGIPGIIIQVVGLIIAMNYLLPFI